MCVWDQNGKEWLDVVFGGVWIVNVGYGCEFIVKVVYDQILKMCYFVQVVGLVFGVLFVEKFIEKMLGMSCVYYVNLGFEVNEKVFKMVCQIVYKKYGGKKIKIFYCDCDYYGLILVMMFVGGQ